MTEHTTLRDGNRLDLTATFVSRRVVDCDRASVRRLLVETETDERLALFIPSGGDPLPDLATGRTYRFRRVLACAPAGSGDGTAGAVEAACGDCGAALRRGMPIDAFPAVAAALERLDVDGPVGVLDEGVGVESAGDPADDWRPRSHPADVDSPPFVCPNCGNRTADPVADRSGSDDRRVDHASHSTETAPLASPSAGETVGLAAGGANDVANFRENVRQGYTPSPEAIAEEGLFADYHFETAGTTHETDATFAPRYAGGVTEHPLSGETERYLAVGLDSTVPRGAFDRPPLDLVAVLDVSGSMDCGFDRYYYDEHGRRRRGAADDGADETKLDAAIESLCALTEQLRETDRFGVVLFDSRAHVAKPLRDVGETDMAAIQGHIRDLEAGGGTNMAEGFEAAAALLADDPTDRTAERRVVFVTDAMPNTGTTDRDGLASLFAEAAVDGIHATFVGVGIDANATLVDELSRIRGANHFFVRSAAEFERRLGAAFDYVVAPLVYDLALELETDGYEIEEVFGSPTGDAATGRLLHVGTLFPSPKADGETRGGVVLVRVSRTGDADASLALTASWTERDGTEHAERVRVDLPESGYDHGGVRKAVALTRYARTLRAWAADVHRRAEGTGVDDWLLDAGRGEHERESVPLVVPDEHAERIDRIRGYLRTEAAALDVAVDEELAVLDRLLTAADGRVPIEGER